MPIYEYRCGKCGTVIEKIQKFSDAPLKKHPGCGGALTKLISQSSFQLKGSGWYATDYAGKGSGKESEATAEAAKGTSKSDSDKGADAGKSTDSPAPHKKSSSKTGTKAGLDT